MAEKLGILLLAHGSPERVADVPEFLKYVTGGRGVPPHVVEEIQHRYGLLPELPLTRITLEQGAALEAELGVPVFVGMRNWHPFIADAVAQMRERGITRAVAICLAPQNSRTSTGLYRKALEAAQPGFEIDFVESWHDHPLLAEAFAERLRADWSKACEAAGAKVPVIFTAHSVPERTIQDGDPYSDQTKETAALVAGRVPEIGGYKFAFQSQGMSGGTWLGPTVEETITALKAEGHNAVFVQPIGFVCDHVEILYDIDIAFRECAESQGMRLWRAGSLNTSPTFIRALAKVARARMAAVQTASQ